MDLPIVRHQADSVSSTNARSGDRDSPPELPLAALRMAIAAKQPGPGLIHHSDRGQYASEDYRKMIQSAGFQSRRLSFFDTLWWLQNGTMGRGTQDPSRKVEALTVNPTRHEPREI